MEIIYGLLIGAGIAYFFFNYLKGKGNSNSDLFIQQQVENLRTELRENMSNTSTQIAREVRNITDGMTGTLEEFRKSVKDKMELQNNTLSSNFSNVSNALQSVSKQYGEIKQSTEEMKNLSQSFLKLEELLRSPKLRGGIGEVMLEEILRQILPSQNYQMQYTFKSGEKVDAAVKTSQGILPIDSKFPLENFRKMYEATTDEDKKLYFKTFISDVKKHIDAISKKYILQDEGTFDFALMFIPAENIYYETIIKSENQNEDKSLNAYCIEKRVFATSPNTLYSHLSLVVMGLKGMQVEEQAKEIMQNLDRLKKDLGIFEKSYELLGKHMKDAQKIYDSGSKQLDKFDMKLQITTGSNEITPNQLT